MLCHNLLHLLPSLLHDIKVFLIVFSHHSKDKIQSENTVLTPGLADKIKEDQNFFTSLYAKFWSTICEADKYLSNKKPNNLFEQQ